MDNSEENKVVRVHVNSKLPDRNPDEVNYGPDIKRMILPDFKPFEFQVFLALSQQVNILTEQGIVVTKPYKASLSEMRKFLKISQRKISKKRFLETLSNVTTKLGQTLVVSEDSSKEKYTKYEKYTFFSYIGVDDEKDEIVLGLNPLTMKIWTELNQVIRPSINDVIGLGPGKYLSKLYLELLPFQDTGKRIQDLDIFLKKMAVPDNYRSSRYSSFIESRVLTEANFDKLENLFPNLDYEITEKVRGGKTITFTWDGRKKGTKYLTNNKKDKKNEIANNQSGKKLTGYQIGKCLDELQKKGWTSKQGKRYLDKEKRDELYGLLNSNKETVHDINEVIEFIETSFVIAIRDIPNIKAMGMHSANLKETKPDWKREREEAGNVSEEEKKEARRKIEEFRNNRKRQ